MKRTDELRIIIRPPPSLLFPRLDSFSSREILFSLETSNDSTFSYCQLDFVTNSTLGVATVREHDLRSTGRWSRRELKIMENRKSCGIIKPPSSKSFRTTLIRLIARLARCQISRGSLETVTSRRNDFTREETKKLVGLVTRNARGARKSIKFHPLERER